MRAHLVACIVVLVVVTAAYAGFAEEALAKQLQVVTARGNVFTAKTDSNTTTVIHNTQVINNTQIINNTESGIGAGALGTSGRLVSIQYDGRIVYGVNGEPGVIKKAESFNWYDGTIDYVGFVPAQSTPTWHSLESPYGEYYFDGYEFVSLPGNDYPIDIAGSRALEGPAPVIRDYSRSVEVDVNGKTIVKMDKSAFGSKAFIQVDASSANVTSQVTTSPNDLINTEYRNFNGTGKFLLYEGQAQQEPERTISMGNDRYRCGDYQGDYRYRCIQGAGKYGETSSSLHQGYLKYFKFRAGTQNAIATAADIYLSDVENAFTDSEITTSFNHGCIGYRDGKRGIFVCTKPLDSSIFVSEHTHANGLFHLTSFKQESQGTASFTWSRQGNTYNAYAVVNAAGVGTIRVTDAAPYVTHGSIGPYGSNSIITPTDSDIYVVLEGTGTAVIKAYEAHDSDKVELHGLPSNVPWVLESPDGRQSHVGVTSSSGAITMPVQDDAGEFSLLVYENDFSDRVHADDILLDLVNDQIISMDFGDPSRNLVYIPSNYLLYPMTTSVDIDNVRLAEIREDCDTLNGNEQPLGFLNKGYDAGSTMHVPFIPGMSALKLTIGGADVCVKFEDVAQPVHLVPFRGETKAAKESPFIDLTAQGQASFVVTTNSPVTVSVSFGAGGFSEHSRYSLAYDVVLTNTERGNSLTCKNDGLRSSSRYVLPTTCPEPAQSMLNAATRSGIVRGMDNYFTTYEVTVEMHKNGELLETVALPVTSLTAAPPLDLADKFGLGTCTMGRNSQNLESVPLYANQTTVTGGHGTFQYYCITHPHSSSYHSIAGTAWSQSMSHMADITDAGVGDQIDIKVSNRIIFNFPFALGHDTPYNFGGAVYDWPDLPQYQDEIARGAPFLNGQYDRLVMNANERYGENDRGVSVTLDNGFVMVSPAQ